jgi:ABC-type antimicrobial peptide transport system permease subunit
MLKIRDESTSGAMPALRDAVLDLALYRSGAEHNEHADPIITVCMVWHRATKEGNAPGPAAGRDATRSLVYGRAKYRLLQSVTDRPLARVSFTLVLLAIAGGMALLGIYGVISYSVSQRTCEIGTRIAQGAPLQNVTGLFVRYGLVSSCIGAICGLAAAFVVTRLMKSLLFEASPADPLTCVAASTGLILAAILRSYLPARRATRVHPLEALRAE